MSYNNGPKIVTNGLVLYLDAGTTKSYPGSGTTWTDLSGNNNNGTLINGPTYNSANKGSIVFDGINDFINCSNAITNFTNLLTVNFWGRISGSPGDGIIITKGENDNSITSNFGFQISSSFRLRLYAKQSGLNYTTIDSNANILNNNINYYSVVFSSGSVSFYRNTILYSSHSFGLSSLPSTTGPLYIGALKGYSFYYPGNLYSITMYNQALSATAIMQNYKATKGRYNL